jgi:hypothetical protein
MTSLRELVVMDCSGSGTLYLDYPSLPHIEKLDIVTDDVCGLGQMHGLRTLKVTCVSSPVGYAARLVEELKECRSLELLTINMPERAWRWAQGLGDIAGLDELVLASPVDSSFPRHPVSGPGRYLESVLRTEEESDGDKRVTTPARSRPRSLVIGANTLPWRSRRTRSDCRRDSTLVDAFCNLLLRFGVRESITFVGSGVDVVDEVVRVNELESRLNAWSVRDA